MYIMIDLDKKHTAEEVFIKTLPTRFQTQRIDGHIRLVFDVTSSTELRQTEQKLEEIGLFWDRMWVI